MSCNKYLEAIIKDIKGELDQPFVDHLHEHLNECQSCMEDYKQFVWLQKGMKLIENEPDFNHISSRLLYEYVTSKNTLSGETVQFIEQHIKVCDNCRNDLVTIKELISSDLLPTEKERKKIFSARLLFKRPAFVYIFAVILTFIAAYFIHLQLLPNALTGIHFIDENSLDKSKFSIKELHPMKISRGSIKGTFEPPIIKTNNTRNIVLKLNISTISERSNYSIKIIKEDGTLIWNEQISKKLLSSNNLLLTFGEYKLVTGLYYIEIIEHHKDGYDSLFLKSAFRLVNKK